MKLLFLGGTAFVGRHMVDAAQSRGHEVTLFTRGQTNADLFPDAEKLRGDRDGDMDALKGRRWDAVIDVNGYVPRIVRMSAELLKDAVDRYVFISTLGVYARFDISGQDENAPLTELDDELKNTEVYLGPAYSGLKVLCERVVEEVLPGRALTIRPGFVVGPHDYTDRFTYWLRRIDQGGDMLAPGSPDLPVQFVDGRDLGEWMIRMVEAKASGSYNATGPAAPMTWGQLFEQCKNIRGRDTRLTWVSEPFLEAQNVDFGELPMWVGSSRSGLMTMNCRKAIAGGLTFRPLAETIHQTLAWDAAEGQPSAGLKPEREAELLGKWRAQSQGNP